MSAGQGPDRNGDAEQLAAAIEQGRPPGSVGGGELARDLDIVAMLRTRGAAHDPHPKDRARAKQNLMSALMAANSAGTFAPSEPAARARPTAPGLPAPGLPAPGVPAPGVPASELTDPLATAGAEDATTVFDLVTEDEPATAPAVVAPRASRSGRHSLPARPAGRSGSATRPPARGLRRRAALVGAAALIALVMIAGIGNVASRDALPGDVLYAAKRLSENTGLAFTFDDAARAQRHLKLATTRLDEVEQIVGRDSADPELLGSAMRDFDASTGEGSRMLLATDDASGPAALADLRTWASDQAARLSVLRSSLPEPAVTDADTSIALLGRLLGRTEALGARSSCSEVTSSVVDDLGRLPAEGTCSPPPAVTDDPTSGADGSSAPSTPGAGAGTGAATSDPTAGPEAPGGPVGPGDPGPGTGPTPEDPGTQEGPLPDPGTGRLPLPDGDGLSSNTGTAPADDEVSVPLPLVPPVRLPPLLPGRPSVTIG